MSNRRHRLYVGATTDLPSRVEQHRLKLYPNGFTARYVFDRLVVFEAVSDYETAVKRERQIKGWVRAKKVTLIQARDPNWLDLSATWTELLQIT